MESPPIYRSTPHYTQLSVYIVTLKTLGVLLEPSPLAYNLFWGHSGLLSTPLLGPGRIRCLGHSSAWSSDCGDVAPAAEGGDSAALGSLHLLRF